MATSQLTSTTRFEIIALTNQLALPNNTFFLYEQLSKSLAKFDWKTSTKILEEKITKSSERSLIVVLQDYH